MGGQARGGGERERDGVEHTRRRGRGFISMVAVLFRSLGTFWPLTRTASQGSSRTGPEYVVEASLPEKALAVFGSPSEEGGEEREQGGGEHTRRRRRGSASIVLVLLRSLGTS